MDATKTSRPRLTLETRLMEEADFGELVTLDRECGLHDPWSVHDFLSALLDHSSRCRVVALNGEIVGYAVWVDDRRRRTILVRLAVRYDYRRCGIGSLLAWERLRKLSDRRTEAWCVVDEGNLEAQLWLRDTGWIATGIDHNDDTPEIAFVFRVGWPLWNPSD